MTFTNEFVEKWIVNYMAIPENNNMKRLPLPAYGTPVVGFSSAADELYPFYKDHIDPAFYRLPTEWLEKTFGHAFDPENVSVISWVLPQTEDTRRKAAACTDCPTTEWNHVRLHGEACNRALAKALETFFNENGVEAVAPMCSEEFSWGDSEEFYLISNWSERHTALISGLGTFGLCDGLISKVGKAVRYGSVIVNCKLTPTKRDYTRYNEYCQAENGCTACIRRCPAGAISLEGGHDKVKCREYQSTVIKRLLKERYDYEEFAVCGLCQTGVPCEYCVPGKKDTP